MILPKRLFVVSLTAIMTWLVLASPPGAIAALAQDASSFIGEKNALKIPPLMKDENPGTNAMDITLRAMQGRTSFFGTEHYTKTLGYNGSYLGPAIKVERGQILHARVINELDDDTTLHWHGMKVEGQKDGGPHYPFAPGETWEVSFLVDQPAAILWFHPHPHGRTGRQVYMGLAGILIVEDDISRNLDLPGNYGKNDIPLVIQDKRFSRNGELVYLTHMMDTMHGMMGDVPVVNGTYNPYLEVEREMIRFRLVNGSNARVFDLFFENNRTFWQIASDGGFLSSPVQTRVLTLAPGERAEILVDFSSSQYGDRAILRSPEFEILACLVNNNEGAKQSSLPRDLTQIEPVDTSEVVRNRTFVLSGMGPMVSINGRQFDLDRIDEVVQLNDTEIWEIRNEMFQGGPMGGNMMRGMGRMDRMGGRGMPMARAMAHPFHIHGVQFRVIERDGSAPPINERGWKDTVLVYPYETVRVLVQFQKKGTFVYHCHILEHDDMGMMGSFVVE
ncbi:MAG: multicopper oxidase domain-containing protein [Synergistales bacterium]|nr:multicopper oxidase domain-containing protein [Synergistales bacterium]